MTMKNKSNKISIALVDDQLLFRKGMKAIIHSTKDLEVILEADNGNDFLNQLEFSYPDIVLLDLEMPVMNGVETLHSIQKNYPAIRTIMLTVHNEPSYIARIIELGANGYLQKNTAPESVLLTIRQVSKSGFYLDELTQRRMREGLINPHRNITINPENLLTSREKEILQLICNQYTTQEIAKSLFLSERTVDGHRNNILHKTGSKNLAGVVIYAIQAGIFNPG